MSLTIYPKSALKYQKSFQGVLFESPLPRYCQPPGYYLKISICKNYKEVASTVEGLLAESQTKR